MLRRAAANLFPRIFYSHHVGNPNHHPYRAHFCLIQQQQPSSMTAAAPMFLTFAAALLICRPLATLCDAARLPVDYEFTQQTDKRSGSNDARPQQNCPATGCALLPQDVHYTSDALRRVLENMRNTPRSNVVALSDWQTSGRHNATTLTLIGYKGGPLHEQINQDRGIVISPYYIDGDKEDSKDSSSSSSSLLHVSRQLIAVFDGHAKRGELVADYVVQHLPALLAEKLRHALDPRPGVTLHEQHQIEATEQALIDTFVQLDHDVPAAPSGGCTATVILQQGYHVFVANAGDSRSFVVTYRPSTGVSRVVYISREDKPELPDEKARVESYGGQVYLPVRGTSRVVYHDPTTGVPTGLAMSRSIGDWAAGKLGVIPNPIVKVLDVRQVVRDELQHQSLAAATATTAASSTFSYVVDAVGGLTGYNRAAGGGAVTNDNAQNDNHEVDDDVHVFAVSASDGLMDFVAAEEIARVLGNSLFDDEGVHPLTACEQLIFAAANAWQQSKQGRYRDDITISVSTLRTPPFAATSEEQNMPQ